MAIGGSVVTPVVIGVGISVVLFILSYYVIKKDALKATHVTFVASLLVLVSSFVIGSWVGMGIGIVSLGMLLCASALYVLNFTVFKHKHNTL